MKNSIINSSFIVLLVMAVGCSEANPDAELDLGVESDLTLNATQDTCCGISYEVYDTTVMMWEQSWKWANPAATPPNYVLSEDKFNSLYIEGAEGVRVYYGLMPETTIPILVIVNIDKCDDLTTE
ncbi:MAG: Iap family predicted aminopeptidase, partial [Crocinitomicaceae bacterium]